jgi:hypothetical protein
MFASLTIKAYERFAPLPLRSGNVERFIYLCLYIVAHSFVATLRARIKDNAVLASAARGYAIPYCHSRYLIWSIISTILHSALRVLDTITMNRLPLRRRYDESTTNLKEIDMTREQVGRILFMVTLMYTAVMLIVVCITH